MGFLRARRGKHLLRTGALMGALLAVGCGDDGKAANAGATKYGAVSLTLADAFSGVELSATGMFANGPAPEKECTSETLGTCELLHCTFPDTMNMPAEFEVGTIEITGSGETLKLKKNIYDSYGATTANPSIPPAAHWQGGESLTLRVSGSTEFPAMEATLVAPLAVELDPWPEELLADPGADVEVKWSTPRTGSVNVGMASFNGAKDPFLLCEFPAEAGSATLPAQLISRLNWSSAHIIDADTSAAARATRDGALLTFDARHVNRK